jgi:hypothetical protein
LFGKEVRMFFWKNEKIYNQFKEISERYNSHFGEDFPVYLIIPFEVDEEAISKYNSVVNSCIKKNEAFEKPIDYDDRIY